MAKITYIEHDGTTHVVEVAAGRSVMEGARDNNLRGVIAECGGACACATCHVYVDPDWMDRVPAQLPAEADMLEFAAAPQTETSRLSCQITVDARCDGLVVRIPPDQGF